jgi:hypothetical protein
VDNLLDVAVAEKAILKLHSMRDGSPVTVRRASVLDDIGHNSRVHHPVKLIL